MGKIIAIVNEKGISSKQQNQQQLYIYQVKKVKGLTELIKHYFIIKNSYF